MSGKVRIQFIFNLQVKHGSEDFLWIQNGVNHLRKTLHMYPNSGMIRLVHVFQLKESFAAMNHLRDVFSCTWWCYRRLRMSMTNLMYVVTF